MKIPIRTKADEDEERDFKDEEQDSSELWFWNKDGFPEEVLGVHWMALYYPAWIHEAKARVEGASNNRVTYSLEGLLGLPFCEAARIAISSEKGINDRKSPHSLFEFVRQYHALGSPNPPLSIGDKPKGCCEITGRLFIDLNWTNKAIAEAFVREIVKPEREKRNLPNPSAHEKPVWFSGKDWGLLETFDTTLEASPVCQTDPRKKARQRLKKRLEEILNAAS